MKQQQMIFKTKNGREYLLGETTADDGSRTVYRITRSWSGTDYIKIGTACDATTAAVLITSHAGDIIVHVGHGRS